MHTARTPLHTATLQGNPAVVEALLIGGADVNVRREDGETPIDVATDQKIIELLRQHANKK